MASALAIPLEDWSAAQRHLTEALTAVGWPAKPASIPRAEELTADQRVVAVLLAGRPGTYAPSTFAIPMSAWNRRRWLGIDLPSALEREHGHDGETGPLWRLAVARQRTSEEMVRLLMGVPLPGRLEAFRDLCMHAYDCHMAGEHQVAPALLAGDFGPEVAEWAPRLADELVDRWCGDVTEQGGPRALVRELRFAVFLPLARARIPIEQRWEALLPLGLGPWREWMHECVQALAPKRRDKALKIAFERELDDRDVLAVALDLLSIHRTPWLLRQVLSRARKHERMTESELLARVAALVEDDPDLKALVDAHEAERRPSPALCVRRVLRPAAENEVPAYLRPQVQALSSSTALFEPDARLTIVELAEPRTPRTYTAIVHHVDTGVVFRGRTTDVIAHIIQFHIECDDTALAEGLQAALGPGLRAVS
jgi:hypothetical protein